MSEEKYFCTHDLIKNDAPPATQMPTRTINAEVPESVYWHVRKCATESRLSMKEYLAKFCEEAWIYPQDPQQITPATIESGVSAAAQNSNQETNR